MGFEISKITDAKLKEIAEKADQGNGYIESVASDGGKELTIFMSEAEKAGFKREVVVNSLAEVFVKDEEIGDTVSIKKADETKTEVKEEAVEKEVKPFAKEQTQLDKYNEVLTAYKQKRAEGLSPKKAYKAVKKEFKGTDHNAAIARLKDYAKETDSFLTTAGAVRQAADTAIEDKKYDVSGKDLKSDAKSIMKDDHNWDKWTKRQNNGLRKNLKVWVSGEDSAMKDYRKAQATRVNKVEAEQKRFTIEELRKELGKNCPYLQKDTDGKTVLEQAGLIEKQEDGKFVMTEKLITLLDEGVGDDNTLSRQKNGAVAEIANIKGDLAASIKESTGLAADEVKVKDKYIKRLVKFAGNRVEKKQFGTMLYQNLVGAPLGALVGALSTGTALLMQGKDVINIKKGLEGTINLNFSFNDLAGVDVDSFVDAFANQNGINAAKTNSGISVGIDISKAGSQQIIELSKHLQGNVLRSALTGAAIGLAIALLETAADYGKSEEEVVPTIQNCTTYESLVTKLNSMVKNKAIDQKYAEALKLIASTFINEDGSFNCNEFIELLGGGAGKGSRLNRTELIMALEKRQGKKPQQTITTQGQNNTPVVNCDEQYKDGETVVTKTHEYKVEYRDTWPKMVLAKYPCLVEKYGITKANEMMRKALCYDENGNFDKSKWAKIRSGWMPKVINFPDEIDGCKYEDNKVEKVSVQELTRGPKKYKGTMGSIGNGRKYTTDTTYTNSCHPGVVGKGKNRQEAEANFQDQLLTK